VTTTAAVVTTATTKPTDDGEIQKDGRRCE
jgi:hypothetical protein